MVYGGPGDQQNLGNSLGARSSTRVHKPPGGASSICLGWEESPDPRKQHHPASGTALRDDVSEVSNMTQSHRVRAPPGGASSICLDHGEVRLHAQTPRSTKNKMEDPTDMRYVQQRSNTLVCGNHQNTGDLITDKSRSRVGSTPGGDSSFSLGWQETPSPRFRGSNITPRTQSTRTQSTRTPQAWEADGSNMWSEIHSPTFTSDDASCVDSTSMHDFAFGRHSRASSNSFANGDNLGESKVDRNKLSSLKKRISKKQSVASTDSRPARSPADGNCTPLELHSIAEFGDFAATNDVDSARMKSQESSNGFANGAHQNCGNFVTDTPSTRVSAPPGGISSVCFGDDRSEEHFDSNSLRSLKARMSKKQQPSSCGSGSVVGHEVSPCGRRERPEVEGSRPKVWKPTRMPRAPPGGVEAYDVESADRRFDGKKLFPDGGSAGNNRDVEASESLRFYQQPDQRLGKQHVSADMHTRAEQRARESNRYHLGDAVESDRVPGRARCHKRGSTKAPFSWELEECTSGGKATRAQAPSSQSTCVGSSESCLQEFSHESSFVEEDDLPLGAEWSSFYGETCA